MNNLLEFAQNTQPGSADALLMPFARCNGTNAEFYYRHRTNLSAVTSTPQWSEDLVHWRDATASFPVQSIDALTEWRKAVVPGGSRLFMRLKVEMPN